MPTYTAYLPRNGNFSKDIVVAQKAVQGLFADVVVLEAANLEDVYDQLNHGSGRELEGYRGRSLSVGDVVVKPDGKLMMVDSCGWMEI
jgi:hypothetical protein